MLLKAITQIDMGRKTKNGKKTIHMPGDEFKCSDKEVCQKLVSIGAAKELGKTGVTDAEREAKIAKRDAAKAKREAAKLQKQNEGEDTLEGGEGDDTVEGGDEGDTGI